MADIPISVDSAALAASGGTPLGRVNVACPVASCVLAWAGGTPRGQANVPRPVGAGALAFTKYAPTTSRVYDLHLDEYSPAYYTTWASFSLAGEMLVTATVMTGAPDWPTWAMEGGIDEIFALPTFTAEGTGIAGEVAELAHDWPDWTLAGTVLPGSVLVAALEWSAWDGVGVSPTEGAGNWPSWSLDASLIPGATADASLIWSPWGAEAAPLAVQTADADLRLPLWSLDAVGASGQAIAGAGAWSLGSLAGEGQSGIIATAELIAPAYLLAASAYPANQADAALDWPGWFLVGELVNGSVGTYRALALNVQNLGLSDYDAFEFNSLAVFGDRVLAAGAAGIVELDGDLDDDAAIAATIQLAISDFGSEQLKRAEAIYVGYRADGDLMLRITCDDDQSYEFVLEAAGHRGLATRRLKLGRGMRSRYWQIEINNTDGGDFTLDSIAFEPVELSRRI